VRREVSSFMSRRTACFAVMLMVVWQFAIAKDKKKVPLPADILQAKTVLVMVDPNAGVDVTDPTANRLARVDVEQALDKWGRFRLVQDGYTADLIIVVRKGNGKVAQSTIGGTPVNGTPPISVGSTSTQDGSTTHAAGRWGNSGIAGDPSNGGTQTATPYPQTEIGAAQDTLAVYRSGIKDDPHWSPLDTPAVWRYSGKDALEAPTLPAVDAFRKAIADSEKQLAANP
jgi:hypothetical protein